MQISSVSASLQTCFLPLLNNFRNPLSRLPRWKTVFKRVASSVFKVKCPYICHQDGTLYPTDTAQTDYVTSGKKWGGKNEKLHKHTFLVNCSEFSTPSGLFINVRARSIAEFVIFQLHFLILKKSAVRIKQLKWQRQYR